MTRRSVPVLALAVRPHPTAVSLSLAPEPALHGTLTMRAPLLDTLRPPQGATAWSLDPSSRRADDQ